MASRSLAPLSRSRPRTPAFPALLDPFQLMNTLLSDMVSLRPSDSGNTMLVQPRMNIDDTGSEVRVTAELPGVSENDVQIMLDDDILIIAGEKREEREVDDRDVRLVERVFGQFRRAVRLPFSPNPDQVDATFKDGVLTITVPKNAEQRSRQQVIQVRHDAAANGADADQGTNATARDTSAQGGSSDNRANQRAGESGETSDRAAQSQH